MNTSNVLPIQESTSELLELFSIPLFKFRSPHCEILNKELKELILSLEKQDSGVQITNIGGWHSQKDLLSEEHDCVSVLRSHILTAVVSMTEQVLGIHGLENLGQCHVEAWANINRYGDYNRFHDHKGSIWSGVYYVDIGKDHSEQLSGGELIFEPQGYVKTKENGEGCRYVVEPESGLMVIFPSSFWHKVMPYHGSSSRISIAFNLKFSNLEMLEHEHSDTRGWLRKHFPGLFIPIDYCRKKIKSFIKSLLSHV